MFHLLKFWNDREPDHVVERHRKAAQATLMPAFPGWIFRTHSTTNPARAINLMRIREEKEENLHG